MARITLTKEQNKNAVEEIRSYFENERDESIGDLQGQLVLDFIIDKIGPIIYNQGIEGMQRYMNEKVEDMYGYML